MQRNLFFKSIKKFGTSKYFNYKINPKQPQLEIWSRLWQNELHRKPLTLPTNGFEEMIRLTDEGKLWHYPIDNDQALPEKDVPFEDHVFLVQYLDQFPKNTYIQNFMSYILNGLSRNPWMDVGRKKEIVEFYQQYFEQRKEYYEESGLKLESAADVGHTSDTQPHGNKA